MCDQSPQKDPAAVPLTLNVIEKIVERVDNTTAHGQMILAAFGILVLATLLGIIGRRVEMLAMLFFGVAFLFTYTYMVIRITLQRTQQIAYDEVYHRRSQPDPPSHARN